MNPFLIKTVFLKSTVSLAAMGMGFYLYHRYKKDRRRMVGMTTGMLVGHKLGAAAGGVIAGPMGAMAGMTVGCLSGCMVGGSLAENENESCCEDPPKTKKSA